MKKPWVKWEILAILSLLLFTIPAVKTLFGHGYFSNHDGDFHLIRLAHFFREATTGQFPVRVVPELAEGYGYPVFNFFYPFPYMVASLFHAVGLSLGDSLKTTMIVATFLSVVLMYAWLRQHFSRWPAWVGAMVYLYVPFRFVTMYVTGQLGGMMAFVWVPLLLWSVYLVLHHKRWWAALGVSVGVAGFLLSHLISVVAFLPLLILYTILLYWPLLKEKKPDWKTKLLPFVILSASGLLGLGLAAFYVLPAQLEAKYVKLGHQVLVQYQDHWPSFKQLLYSPWGYGYSMTGTPDGMSFQLGIAQWVVLGFATVLAAYVLIRRQRLNQEAVTAISFLILSIGTLLLMLPISKPIWEVISPLQYLQYSWRLLAVMMCLVAFLVAWIAAHRWGSVLAFGIVLLAVVANRNHLRTWEMIRYPDSHYLERSYLYRGSTDISWEALPVQAATPPVGPAPSLIHTPLATVSAQPSRFHTFNLELTQSQPVTLNLLYFPSWQVFVDDHLTLTTPSEAGLLRFIAPAGMHHFSVKLQSTPVEHWSNMISVVSIPLSVLWFVFLMNLDRLLVQPSQKTKRKRE